MSRGWRSARLAGGLLAALLAAYALPRMLPPGDAFRGTLALLPFLVAVFAGLAAWGRAQGGRALPRRARLVEAVALALLVLLTLARDRLGFGAVGPHADEILAAGYVLLLAHRLVIQLLACRPLLGRTLPARPGAIFFFLPLVAYLAILPWSSGHREPDGDEPFYLLMTHSLAYDGDVDLTNNYAEGDWKYFMSRPIEPQPGDPVGPHGELYSRHNELLPLALVPAYRLAGKPGALATMAALAAALAWMCLKLAARYFPERPGEALAAYGLAAFASPLVLYSYQVWVEVPAALLATVALDQILALRNERRWDRRRWLRISLPILLLPLVKIRFMLLAVPLVALGWWHAGRPRKPLLILAGLLAAVGLGLLVHNQLLYGNPLKIHSVQELELYKYSPRRYAEGFLGLFYDTAFGLFGTAPLWLLGVPALLLLVARRHRLLFDLGLFSAPYLLVVVPRPEWYGGWSPPFRYALILLPLLAAGLVPLLAARRRPGARALVAGLGLLTLALMTLWLVVPGWTYNFAHGRTYLLDALDARLAADVGRLFPSSVRDRTATWLWPIATLVVLPLLWWLPRGRPRSPGLWGAAGLLAATALVPVLATRLPTRVVEFEDAYVAKDGGNVYPQTWIIERTRYRGGWVLRSGERLTAPIVPGGREATITLSLRYVRNGDAPLPVVVRVGGRTVARWDPGPEDAGVWRELAIGPLAWPAGAPLVVAVEPVPHLNGVILDKAVFDWR